MQVKQRIAPCLWFDDQAEQAAAFYVSVFKNSRIVLSWQVVPRMLPELLKDHDSETARRAMDAILRMKKIDINELERAVAVRK